MLSVVKLIPGKWDMRRKGVWLKVVLGILILVWCFAPLIPVSYEVIVERQVSEEYTTVEPYTVLEEVQELEGGYYMYSLETRWKWYPKYRTVTREVTKYREVTKTRLVERPVVETQTKQVSILRYLLDVSELPVIKN